MVERSVRIAAAAAFITVTLWLVYFPGDKLRRQPIIDPVTPALRYEVWGIRDLNEVIQVSSIRVQTAFEKIDLPIKQETNLPLSFTDVNLTVPFPDIHTEATSIIAPDHHPPDASHLLVGLATKLSRLRDALPAFAHWASGTGVRFVALVAPGEEGEVSVDEVLDLYSKHDIQLTLLESSLPWYEAYVSLLAILYDHADARTKWACTIDDDTYFFSMKRVLAMLDKYDAREPYYVGGVSENKETWDRMGFCAYGGGGIFYSVPLLKQLRLYNKECLGFPEPAGDLRIGHCVTTYSLTKFTWEHYLFQMDIHGDLTGFYEAARTRPISTHHWNSWHFHDMVKVGAVGKVCGNECVLQKYVTSDGWMMTNGFSIVKYSYSKEEEMKYIEGAMEHTWADTIWVRPNSWNYTLAPLRPKDEGKIQYVIEKVEEDENTMTIYYVRRKDGLGLGIIQMIWTK